MLQGISILLMNMGKNEQLNDRQMEFARGLAAGLTKSEAYRKAFDCSKLKDQTVASNACRLAKNANVLQKLDELRREADSEAVLSVRARKEWLSRRVMEAAGGEPAEVANGIRAVQELNRMDGAYAPDRVEAKVETCSFENILAIIEERKKGQRCDDNV